jgi:hypothetical protein
VEAWHFEHGAWSMIVTCGLGTPATNNWNRIYWLTHLDDREKKGEETSNSCKTEQARPMAGAAVAFYAHMNDIDPFGVWLNCTEQIVIAA